MRLWCSMMMVVVGLVGPAWAQTSEPAPTPDTSVLPPDDQAPEPAKPLPAPTPTPAAANWVRQGAAVVQVLDKVDARSATLVVPVGGQQVYRAVTIAVKACATRPADQAPDATAYVSVVANGGAVPSFIGWLLEAEPAASLMQDPVYDIRLLGCQ